MKNKAFKILALFVLLLTPLTFAWAADTKTGIVYVAKDDIVSGNLYAAGESITIDGTVSGDLITAAQTVRVNGRIEGDIIAAAQEIVVNGDVGGNIRIAGNFLTINGSVARNVNAFGATIVLGPKSRVGWDVYAAGATVESRGVIDGSLSGQAGQALIAGQIGKNVNLKMDKARAGGSSLTLSSEALINGDLVYTSAETATISDQATVSGEVKQISPAPAADKRFTVWLWQELFAVFAALVVGLVLIFLGKNITPKILDEMETAPGKLLLAGLLAMLVLPPIALILAFTIIGIPLSLIILAVWLIMIYLAKIFTAIFLGRLLVRKIAPKTGVNLIWPLVVGVIIAWLLFSIPYVGWIICLLAAWLGLGGIWNHLRQPAKI